MRTTDDESYIIDSYRLMSFSNTKFYGNYFGCLRIYLLTKSYLFAKSWINSSSKDALPPDFHNEKHHIMMEVMRIDDCVNEINGKPVDNSFAKENKYIKKLFGKNYKKVVDGSLVFNANTKDNRYFTFQGYYKNFERVLMNHSNKVNEYRKNYPKCKTCVLFIYDVSNVYVQVTDENDLYRTNPKSAYLPHFCFLDAKFINIIKRVEADYVIWVCPLKALYVNNKRIKMPRIVIYDVKHLTNDGFCYKHELMYKATKEIDPVLKNKSN